MFAKKEEEEIHLRGHNIAKLYTLTCTPLLPGPVSWNSPPFLVPGLSWKLLLIGAHHVLCNTTTSQ